MNATFIFSTKSHLFFPFLLPPRLCFQRTATSGCSSAGVQSPCRSPMTRRRATASTTRWRCPTANWNCSGCILAKRKRCRCLCLFVCFNLISRIVKPFLLLLIIFNWFSAAAYKFLLNNNTKQLRLPWAWLPLQPLPAAHRGDRLLQRLGGGAVQHWGAAAAPLPGSQRWCQVVRMKRLSVCLSVTCGRLSALLFVRWRNIYADVKAIISKLKFEQCIGLFWVTEASFAAVTDVHCETPPSSGESLPMPLRGWMSFDLVTSWFCSALV